MTTLSAKKKSDRRLQRLKANVFKALGHPVRLAIAEALADGEVCVCELAEAVGAERSNVSRHLSLMVSAGVLVSRKEGLMVYYKLKTPCVLNFLGCVHRLLGEQLTENGRLLKSLRAPRRQPAINA